MAKRSEKTSRGRPPADATSKMRNKLSIMLNDQDADLVERAAIHAERQRSDWVRRTIIAAARQELGK